MPYAVRKFGSGYKVVNKHTGKTYSKHPIPKARAEAQMRALHMHTHESFENKLDIILEMFGNDVTINCSCGHSWKPKVMPGQPSVKCPKCDKSHAIAHEGNCIHSSVPKNSPLRQKLY